MDSFVGTAGRWAGGVVRGHPYASCSIGLPRPPPHLVHLPQIGFTRGTAQHVAAAASHNNDRTSQNQRSDTSNARLWSAVSVGEVAVARGGGGGERRTRLQTRRTPGCGSPSPSDRWPPRGGGGAERRTRRQKGEVAGDGKNGKRGGGGGRATLGCSAVGGGEVVHVSGIGRGSRRVGGKPACGRRGDAGGGVPRPLLFAAAGR